MPRKNLTARFVESVKVEVRTDFWDDVIRGLVLRVSETGVKSWTVVYVPGNGGAKQRVTLGQFPAITLEVARQKALATVAAVGEGKDPSAEKRAKREAMTVRELGALYVEKYAKRNKKSWAEDERILRIEVYPEIGDVRIMDVRRRDVLDIVENKFDAGRPVQSKHILAVLRKMFNWAVDGEYLSTNPAVGIKARGKVVRRDRVLSNDEIRQIWKALTEASLSAATIDILKLLFLTGQRSGEVCGMRRSEVDIEKAVWTIPAARAKNGRAHLVALSSLASDIVSRVLDKAGAAADAPLFSRVGEPIESNAIAQGVRKKLQQAGEPWTPHDIRRTVATGMAGQGIPPHIVEAVLNHVSGFRAGVAGTYNRHAYEPEKRRALDIWAEHLKAVVDGQKSVVVPMARPA